GLADLELTRVVAGVHRGAGGADGAAERVGEFLDDPEVLGTADPAPTGDHDARLGELRTVAGHRGLPRGDLRRVLGRCGHLDVDDLTGALGRLGLDGARTDGVDRELAGDLGLDGERATEDRVHAL